MLPSIALAITSLTFLAAQAGIPQWAPDEKLLSSHEMSLNTRYSVPSVNNVFKDNILLDLAYLDGRVKTRSDINWDSIEAPYTFEFRLNPGETFAFDDKCAPRIFRKDH
jgi:hypothetical protein